MTVYEINYTNRLNEMLDNIIQIYGFEHPITVWFATLVDKYIDNANYDNREIMEKYYKTYVKNA